MASLRFTDLQSRPMEFLDFTSLTLDEFHQLIPPFEAAFHAPMAAWRLDGKPRTARRFSVYQNCPLVQVPIEKGQKNWQCGGRCFMTPARHLLGGDMQGRHSAIHIGMDDHTRATLTGWLRKQ